MWVNYSKFKFDCVHKWKNKTLLRNEIITYLILETRCYKEFVFDYVRIKNLFLYLFSFSSQLQFVRGKSKKKQISELENSLTNIFHNVHIYFPELFVFSLYLRIICCFPKSSYGKAALW